MTEATQLVSQVEEKRNDCERKGMADLLTQADRQGEVIAQCDDKQHHLNQLNQKGLDIRAVYDLRAHAAKNTTTEQREQAWVTTDSELQIIQQRLPTLKNRFSHCHHEAQARAPPPTRNVPRVKFFLYE